MDFSSAVVGTNNLNSLTASLESSDAAVVPFPPFVIYRAADVDKSFRILK